MLEIGCFASRAKHLVERYRCLSSKESLFEFLLISCNRPAVIHSAQRRFHSRARECDRGARMWSTIGASARCHPRAHKGSGAAAGRAHGGPLPLCGLRGCVCQPAGRVGGMEGAGLVDNRQARRREARTRRTRTVLQPLTTTCLHRPVPFTYSVCTSCTVAPADALSTAARRATRAGERDFAV